MPDVTACDRIIRNLDGWRVEHAGGLLSKGPTETWVLLGEKGI